MIKLWIVQPRNEVIRICDTQGTLGSGSGGWSYGFLLLNNRQGDTEVCLHILTDVYYHVSNVYELPIS